MYAWLSFSRSTSFLVLCPFLYYIASFAFFTFSKNIFFHGYNVRHGESTDRNWYKTVYYHYSHNGVVILLFVSYANNGNIRIYRKSMRSFNDQIVSIKQGRCKCFTLVNNSCFNRYWLKCSDELHSLVFRSMLPPGFSFFFSSATPLFEVVMKWVHLFNKRQGRGVLEKVWPCQNSFTDNHQSRQRWEKKTKKKSLQS